MKSVYQICVLYCKPIKKAKKWRPIVHQLINGQKEWSIHIQWNNPPSYKRMEFCHFLKTCKKLKIFMLNEVIQAHKYKSYMISFICSTKNKRYFTDMESRIMLTREWGEKRGKCWSMIIKIPLRSSGELCTAFWL